MGENGIGIGIGNGIEIGNDGEESGQGGMAGWGVHLAHLAHLARPCLEGLHHHLHAVHAHSNLPPSIGPLGRMSELENGMPWRAEQEEEGGKMIPVVFVAVPVSWLR